MLERKRTLENDLDVQRQQREQEQEERRRVFADQSLPNQASTFHQHAIADAAMPLGRFSAISNAQIVGQGAMYPAAGTHQHDPCGPEPPLGYAIDAQEPSTGFLSSPVEQPDGPLAPSTATSPSAVSSNGPSSFSRSYDPATEDQRISPSTRMTRGVAGSSPIMKRRRL
jgi:hypothetical protein